MPQLQSPDTHSGALVYDYEDMTFKEVLRMAL